MKKVVLLLWTFILLSVQAVFAQINTPANPGKPFGTGSYAYGLMPTNLPSGGTYGASQKAADVYNEWKSTYVEACTGGLYRVRFDNSAETVSEGIAYGMLLSAYAADKALFDGLWAYYKKYSTSDGGLMHWKISGCNNVIGSGAATDAELDAAMALIVAAQQWPTSTSPYNYQNEAKTLIGKIKQYEMTSNGHTINGDHWGLQDQCRNPSYFSPAYYKQFAKVDTGNATFWNTTAINATNAVLGANRNSTTGLVSNWCDPSGNENACGPTGGSSWGYGADACRNPWRMAVDYLWHGADAATVSKDINGKLATYVGNGSNMKGPMATTGAAISTGQYRNKTYTMFALPVMAAGTQANVNSCYTNVAGMGNEYENYFGRTLHAITMFVMTGNFWVPGDTKNEAPLLMTAETSADGTKIILNFSKDMNTTAASTGFTLYVDGMPVTGAFSGNGVVNKRTITYTLAAGKEIIPGNVLTLSYSGTTIKCTDGNNLAAFTNQMVRNAIAGNSTVLVDAESADGKTNLCTVWYKAGYPGGAVAACNGGTTPAYNCTQTSSIDATVPMDADGNILPSAGGKLGDAIKVSYKLGTTGGTADPCYANWGCMIGFSLSSETTEILKVPVDITGATEITFDYQSSHANAVMKLNINGKEYEMATPLAATTGNTWKTEKVSLLSLVWYDWGNGGVATELTTADLANATDITFSFKTGAAAVNGTFAVDNIELVGAVIEGCNNGATPCETLALLIEDYQAKLDAAVEGTEPGQYLAPAIAPFQIAINEAETVCPAADAAVTTAINKLKGAYALFDSKKVPSDNNTLIADCEDDNLTKLQTYWSSYVDGTGTTIVPLSSTPANPFEMLGTGKEGSYSASVNGYLPATADPFYPSAGISFPMKEPGDDNLPYDLTGATGIGFWHKGDELTFVVMTTNITPNKGWDFSVTVPQSDEWQYIVAEFPGEISDAPVTPNVPLALGQPTWVASQPGYTPAMGTFEPSMVYKLQWQVKDGAARDYEFAIDEVSVLGLVLDIAAPNYAKLLETIEEATELHDGATEGTEPGNYAPGSKEILEDAINAAQLVADNSTDQEEIDEAVTTLEDAIKAFKDGREPLQNTIIADCEDGNQVPLFDGFWFAYNDNTAGDTPAKSGTSTTVPEAGEEFAMTPGSHDGTNYAELSYTLNGEANLGYNPFSGMGFNFGALEPTYDFSSAEGVTFMYKGPASRLVASINKGGNYGVVVEEALNWEERTFIWSEFAQEEWDTDLDWDATAITGFKWQVQGPDGTIGAIGVDDFQINGMLIEKPKPEGLVLAWNADAAAPKIEYQGKYVPVEFEDYVPKVGDEVTVTISGKATDDITGLKVAIIDDRAGICYWGEFSEVKEIGDITADDVFTEAVTLTIKNIEQTAVNACTGFPLSNPKLVFFGDNATLAAGGAGTEIIITEETISVSIKEYVEGLYKLCWNADDEAYRGTFDDILPLTPEVKIGDKVQVRIAGTATQDIQFSAQVVDVTLTAGYWQDLSLYGGVEFPEFTPGVPFDETIEIEITESAPVGSGAGSQSIVLRSWRDQTGSCTEVILDVFTAEVIVVELDKTALNAAILDATPKAEASNSCENGGSYLAAAVTDLIAKFAAAQTAATAATTQDEIDDAEEALTLAIEAFDLAKITTDKTALNNAILAANAKLLAADEGSLAGQYVVGSKGVFEDAIEAAQAIADDACALDVTDALTDLATAEGIFDDAKNQPVDKTALEDAINEAKKLRADNASNIGDGNGMYPLTADGDLKDAIDVADLEFESLASTTTTVADAIIAIKGAIDNFKNAKIVVDYDDLKDAIIDAQAVYNAAKTAGGNGHYPPAAKTQLGDDIDAAIAVRDNTKATQADVNQAISDLNQAVNDFKETEIETNKGALQLAIEAAEAIDATVGTEAGEYLEGLVNNLNTALTAAKAVYANNDATQEQIDNATMALTTAISKMVPNTLVTKPLEDAITAAEGLRNDPTTLADIAAELYPEDAVTTFDQAIADANTALTTLTKNADILDAAATLDAARVAFLSSRIGMDPKPLQDKIDEAKQMLVDNAGNIDPKAQGKYTQEVYDALDQAVKDADDALDAAVTQGDIVSALTDLEEAIKKFIPNPVDKSELAALFADAEDAIDGTVRGDGDGQYLATVYDALTGAMTIADQVLKDPTAEQQEVDDAKAALQTALDNFEPNDLAAAIAELDQLIKDAQDLHDAADEGEANGEYETGSKAIFEGKIDAAAAVIAEGETPSAAQIADAKDKLQTAIEAFEAKRNVIDLDDLKKLIEDAQKMYDDVVDAGKIGTGNGFYLLATMEALDKAIDDAQAVVDDTETTKGDVTTAEGAIRNAMDNFKAEVVSKTDLEATLLAAQTLQSNTAFGNQDGEYAVALGQALAAAINAAKDDVIPNPQATQEEVNDAETALKNAMKAIDDADPINKLDLKNAIAEAQDILNNLDPADIGTDYGQYPQTAVDVLGAAKGYAEVVDANSADQSEIDTETQQLLVAIANFKKSQNLVDKEELRRIIGEVQDLIDKVNDEGLEGNGHGQYPSASVNDLEVVLATAEAVESNSGATQEVVDTAADDLKEALAKFEGKKNDFSSLLQQLSDALKVANDFITAAVVGEGDGQYPEDDKKEYQRVIDLAQDIYDQKHPAQNTISSAISALNQALEAFKQTAYTVVKDALGISIQTANDALDAVENIGCNFNNCYPQALYEALEEALRTAQSVYNGTLSASASQALVNKTKDDLDKAVDDLQKAKVVVDKEKLEASITQKQREQSKAKVGTQPGEYPEQQPITDFGKAIEAANEVNIDDEATQEMVDNALDALNEEYKKFVDARNPDGSDIDKTELVALINEVSHLYSTSKEVKDGGVYENGSKKLLYDAMIEARQVSGSRTATQDDVDTAVEELTTARDNFLNSTVSMDKTPLQTTIAEAKKELSRSINQTGDEIGQYPQWAVNALTSEIDDAESVLSSATTQEELTKARADLRKVMEEYIASRNVEEGFDPNAVDNLIFSMHLAYETEPTYIVCKVDGYPSAARSRFMTELLRKENDRKAAVTQEALDRIYADLLEAFDEFETSWTVKEDGCSIAVDVVDDASALRVYPTMATNTVTVTASKTIRSIAVVSLGGSIAIMEMPNNTQATIDVTTLSQGSYTVAVTFDDNSTEQRTIIKK